MTAARPAHSPYVSVTGARSEADLAMLDEAESIESPPGLGRAGGGPWHRTVCGVLVSSKTLRNLPLGERYPPLLDVIRLAAPGADVPVWLHFNRSTGFDQDIDQELRLLACTIGGSPRGFQINTPGVPVEVMRRIREEHPGTEIVMQVSGDGVGSLDPSGFDAYVRRYAGLCDHALIDLSRGRGVPIDVEWCADLLNAHARGWLDLGIRPAVAGGLGPDSGEALERLAELVGPILLECSFDAETNVCGPKGLDEGRVTLYRRAVADALGVAHGAGASAARSEASARGPDPLPEETVRVALDLLCCDFDDARPQDCDRSLLGRRWSVVDACDFARREPNGADRRIGMVHLPPDGDLPGLSLYGVFTEAGGSLELLRVDGPFTGRLVALRADLRTTK